MHLNREPFCDYGWILRGDLLGCLQTVSFDDRHGRDCSTVGDRSGCAIVSRFELSSQKCQLPRGQVFSAFDLVPAFSGTEEREKIWLEVAGNILRLRA